MSPCASVRAALDRLGLLLLQDKTLPSVVGVFTGRVVAGSWWGIPEGGAIFQCLEAMEESDAFATRLVNRKVTFVHRRLWPALVSLSQENESWQREGMSRGAQRLLRSLTESGMQTAKGPAAKELRERLLVAATEIHTDSGRHELRLETWQSWAMRKGVEPMAQQAEARRQIEEAGQALGAPAAMLPWHR